MSRRRFCRITAVIARMTAIAGLVTLIVLSAMCPRAAAAEGKQVLFVAHEETSFSARVRAEIETMGFEIVPAETFREDEAPTTVAVARVLETPPPRRVELWIANAGSHRFELRAVVQPSLADDEATQTVRASEQLRAFFQPLCEPLPAPSILPTTPSPVPLLLATPSPVTPVLSPQLPPPPPPASIPTRVTVEASMALPIEPGGPGVDILLQARWMPIARVGIGVLASLPLSGSTVRSGDNSAVVSATLVGADLSLILLDARALRLTASAGFAVAWLRASGAASPPYSAKSDSTLDALPFIGAEIAPRLADHLRLCAGGRVGISLPKSDIAFADSTVAVWGRPLGLVSLGLGLDF